MIPLISINYCLFLNPASKIPEAVLANTDILLLCDAGQSALYLGSTNMLHRYSMSGAICIPVLPFSMQLSKVDQVWPI